MNKAVSAYSSLSTHQRLWFNVQALIGAVNNGGLISHYYNSGADHNAETMEDLIALGFSDVAGLMVQINGLFPGGEPPRDMDARNAVKVKNQLTTFRMIKSNRKPRTFIF